MRCACVIWCAQSWLPQYFSLREDSTEKVAAGVHIFWTVGMATQAIGQLQLLYDWFGGVPFEPFGGFGEFRKVWRRYDFQRDHAFMQRAWGEGMGDVFFWGNKGTAWAMWHGQVAEHVAYMQHLANAVDAKCEEAGGAVTDAVMDPMRNSAMGIHMQMNFSFLCFIGLESLAASLYRKVGLHEWPSAVYARATDFWAGMDLVKTTMAPNVPEVHNGADWGETLLLFAGFAFGVCDCFECIPQSDASNALMRSILRGTATDRPGGIAAIGALNRCCRDTYCFSFMACSARAASYAERLGEHDLAVEFAMQYLSRGGHEFRISQMHAMLGRIEASRGDRAAAVARWRRAAAVAMAGRWHLFALIVAWQCGPG